VDPGFVQTLGRDLAAHLGYAYGHCGPTRSSTGLSASRLATVLQRINSGFAERLTVADLAATVNMSEFHFCRKFRRSTGFSPHAFLTLKRLDRARELLCATARPVAEVATSVGYTTHAHFSSVFHNHAGMPPGQYRRLHGSPLASGDLAE
jgi:AraC family transcriptional regulator